MKAERLAKVLYTATTSRKTADVNTFLNAFVSYITARGYTGLLPRILKEYQRLDAKKSRTGVVVTLAHKRDVEDILSKHHITEKATTKIDETIIGGYHIETQNQLIDATHKNALLTLFQSLTR